MAEDDFTPTITLRIGFRTSRPNQQSLRKALKTTLPLDIEHADNVWTIRCETGDRDDDIVLVEMIDDLSSAYEDAVILR